MSGVVLSAAILIVSDSVAAATSEDRSSVEIRRIFANQSNTTWNVLPVAVVSDEVSSIRACIHGWVAKSVNLIVTSGGTGFAARDNTPEAIEPLLERQAPGLV